MRGSQLPPDAESRTDPSPTDPTASMLPHPCRGEALPRPPRRWRGDSARPTRLARHAARISRAALSTIARPFTAGLSPQVG